jgi:hypothetical protein
MECRDVKKLLSEYIDGVLVPGQVPVVKQHLGACGECKAAYESMNRLIDVMRDMDPVSEPANFGAGVRARMEKQPSLIDRFRSLVSPPLVKVPLGVAAALIVAFAITQIPGPDEQPARDVAVTDELRSFEISPEPATERREKKGESEEEAPSKDTALAQSPAESGAVSTGEAFDRPARTNETKKESVGDETSVVTTGRLDADKPPVLKNEKLDDREVTEVDALTDVPAGEQKAIQPSSPASALAKPDEFSRISTAIASAGGTIIETEGETGGEVEYLVARIPADSIYMLVRILGEETELIMAPELSAFGYQEKSSGADKVGFHSYRSLSMESARKSRAATDSIFVRILVK